MVEHEGEEGALAVFGAAAVEVLEGVALDAGGGVLRRIEAGVGAGLGERGEQGAGPPGGVGGGEARPVEVDDGRGVFAGAQGLGQAGDSDLGGHRREPDPGELGQGLRRGHAAPGPGSPGDRGRGQALRPAGPGEAVEGGVGERVGRLPTAAPDPGDGRETDKCVERLGARAGELVEQQGAPELGLGDGGQGLELELGDRGRVAEQASGMEHGPDRATRGGTVGEDPGQAGARADVAGDHADLGGTELAQLRGEGLGAGAVRTPAAGEDQVGGALPGEPARRVGAQGPEAPGDQGAPAGDEVVWGVDRRLGGGVGGSRGSCGCERGRTDQATGEHLAAADSELIFAVVPVEGGEQGPGERGVET